MEKNDQDLTIKNSPTPAYNEIEAISLANKILASDDIISEVFRAAAASLQNLELPAGLYMLQDGEYKLQENASDGANGMVAYPYQISNTPELQAYLTRSNLIIIHNIAQGQEFTPAEIREAAIQLNLLDVAVVPIRDEDELTGFVIIGSQEAGKISKPNLEKYSMLVSGMSDIFRTVANEKNVDAELETLKKLSQLNKMIQAESNLEKLYPAIHTHIKENIGDLVFFIALYNSSSETISFPYIYEDGKLQRVDPIPIGQGLTSVVIKTRQPLMLVENTEKQALNLGAKITGPAAKSWLGVPLMVGKDVIGIMTIQDGQNEHRFDHADLELMTTIATLMSAAIHSSNLLDNSKRYAIQLEKAARISKESSETLEKDKILSKAILLLKERFGFYHASIYLLDRKKEFAVIQESSGEAGQKMVADLYKFKVGSQSVIGHVTATGESLLVSNISGDPMHQRNPLLPDTKAELGIPLKVGRKVLGALEVQSTQTYSFSPDDIEVLQILADHLAVALSNAELFAETQKHLEQQLMIQRISKAASSSENLEEALNASVEGLHASLGERVGILLFKPGSNRMNLAASAGYENDVLGMHIDIGQGITGWVADTREAALINDVSEDSRYIAGKDSVRSELAVPLLYRSELLGVLNVESDELDAFSERDKEVLITIAGSLATVIANTRMATRQRQLFEITNNIRRSVDVEAILKTTANELNRALKTRRTKIKLGIESEQDHTEPQSEFESEQESA